MLLPAVSVTRKPLSEAARPPVKVAMTLVTAPLTSAEATTVTVAFAPATSVVPVPVISAELSLSLMVKLLP